MPSCLSPLLRRASRRSSVSAVASSTGRGSGLTLGQCDICVEGDPHLYELMRLRHNAFDRLVKLTPAWLALRRFALMRSRSRCHGTTSTNSQCWTPLSMASAASVSAQTDAQASQPIGARTAFTRKMTSSTRSMRRRRATRRICRRQWLEPMKLPTAGMWKLLAEEEAKDRKQGPAKGRVLGGRGWVTDRLR